MPETSTGGVQILLVEDDLNDVRFMLRALGRHVAADEIQVARDGVSALGLGVEYGP